MTHEVSELEHEAATLLSGLTGTGSWSGEPSAEAKKFVNLIVTAAVLEMRQELVRKLACEPSGDKP